MKPDVLHLIPLCPGIDPAFIQSHLTALDDAYFERFSLSEQSGHLAILSALSAEKPFDVSFDLTEDGLVRCRVLAFDYKSVLSVLTGVLSGTGFNIVRAGVFTYKRMPAAFPVRQRRSSFSRSSLPKLRRYIIDVFEGRLEGDTPFESWAQQCHDHLDVLFRKLESGGGLDFLEVKRHVTQLVSDHLAVTTLSGLGSLPVDIKISQMASFTRFKITASDTPMFLYSLINALSLHAVSIEHVLVNTLEDRIVDEIDFVDLNGNPILDPDLLASLKLAVLLTKQFTYFLDQAPDPSTALSRFGQLAQDIIQLPQHGEWLSFLKNPLALKDLARLLGTSDYLWEDFIRVQSSSLLPILAPHLTDREFSEGSESLRQRLDSALSEANTIEKKSQALNRFKDQELFLMDLSHILGKWDFKEFAEQLTVLAEVIVSATVACIYDHLMARFGIPQTVAGLPASYAVLGLGKLGGAALGYASDIELLFVFSDNGYTSGSESIRNLEFFELLVKEMTKFIDAKRDGIFHIDLRLRPFSAAGPVAVSLGSFCGYYGHGGSALFYEKLALVRLRAVAGEPKFGRQIERLRDEFIYSEFELDLEEFWQLRQRQVVEKTKGGLKNAKFSPGALVDIEYAVQLFQVFYASRYPDLKTPRFRRALYALSQAGIVGSEDSFHLEQAYDFCRLLINALRMLRGSAQDVFLPDLDSFEFDHLARRMDYKKVGELEPSSQLYTDFEMHTAYVRAFLEKYFSKDAIMAKGITVADMILSEQPDKAMSEAALLKIGFSNPERAYANLKFLAGQGEQPYLFAKLAVLAFDMLVRKPDPDMALNNWERYVTAIASQAMTHFKDLLRQPKRLDILLTIFSVSQYLSDILIRNPELLGEATDPKSLYMSLRRGEIDTALDSFLSSVRDKHDFSERLRKFKKREMLRIGIRDICMDESLELVARELSVLAKGLCRSAFNYLLDIYREKFDQNPLWKLLLDHTCVVAFGKLGGMELNYSSDIDILVFYDEHIFSSEQREKIAMFLPELNTLVEELRGLLSGFTSEGRLYRVDFRLRPYGSSSHLIFSLGGLLDYYRSAASLWEIQALLKLSPIAGNWMVGFGLIEAVKPFFFNPPSPEKIVGSIESMRNKAIQKYEDGRLKSKNIKSGVGGIRDVEFLVQGLQLIHAARLPQILCANTLLGLQRLGIAEILPQDVSDQLSYHYKFLRRIEHFLQILEDQQIHSLPKKQSDLEALAKRLLGRRSHADAFLETLEKTLTFTRAMYEKYLIGPFLVS